MLSPKMQHRIQRSVRINDGQLLGMAEKARYDSRLSGFLYKRCSDSNKWLLRWFRLYQNLLFYYDNDQTSRPIGIIFLEGCYCERVLSATATKADRDEEKMHCFAIMYRRENQRQYEMRANSASECQAWIESIKMASFNKLHLLMEELEQKHLHLLQVVESEKTAKWQYTQHCEELTEEIKKLRNELNVMKKEWRLLPQMSKSTTSSQDSDRSEENNEDPDIAKIKKVQSFFRGWLCRRRWKQIVDEYIRSPHAESMRKRNCLVFRMVESEEEYVDQLEILISCFLRPFKMAASSKNPPCTHEDINSIFLNSETVLFLHQIFLKGLTARMESWPTLVLGTSLGDLFDMLLPMLTIYQEYVRNHHYSLQVLTECKQGQMFASLLSRLEKKPACKGRSLETFLTYPMHQIPRYIITLHELLAHTPPDHVEKKSLENARDQLEDLSRQMHDEVSETENIRKNLAIERMIVEGCDILLDVNQIFVRQGTLVQIMSPGQRGTTRSRSIFGHEKEREEIRQCFLFSNHLILTSRNQSGGRLHLVEGVGKIPLADITLIEDPNEEDRPDVESSSSSSNESLSDLSSVSTEHKALDFKLIVDDVKTGQQMTVHLVAPTRQEKAAWITDISQCMDNVHFNGLFYNTMPNASSSTLPQCVKSDPNLFKDDAEIRFSKTFNNCKIPQIRYATPDRLLQRLTDLRFLNIDFLNTFLLTYRVFTDAITVLEALKKVFFDPDPPDSPTSSNGSLENLHLAHHNAGSHRQSCGGFSTCCGVPPASVCTEAPAHIMHASAAVATGVAAPCAVTDPGGHGGIHHSAASCEGKRRISTCSGYSTATENAARHGSLTPSSRRISGASSIVSGYYSDDRERNSFSQESTGNYFLSGNHPKTQHWRYSFRKYEEEQRESQNNSNNEGLGVPGSRWSMNSGANKNTNSSTGSVGMGGRKGSHDSRSGSIASTSANLPPWQRKESVTIIERAEDEKDAEDEQRLEKTAKLNVDMSATTSAGPIIRRASSVGEHSDDQFLTVPKSITASSSAETLTDTTLSGPPTPTNLTKVISASSISQTTVVAVPRASGSRSSSGGGTSTSEQLSLDREDDDGNEDLKMDEEPKLVDPAPAAPEPEKDFNDDIMVKMKKDPDPDAYQPIRKKSGPDLQDIKRGLTGGASQQLGTNLKPEHQYKGHKKTSLPTLPSHALCGNSSAGRCRNRSTSTFSTASSASACLAAAFHHTHHHRGHHAHHHYSGQSGGGDGSDMICMMGGSVSQPCSHHPSFSGPTTGKGLFGVLSFKDLTAGLKSPTKEFKKRKGLFQSAASSTNSRCGGDDVPCGSPLSSPQHSKMGVVITSSRQAHRRSSSASAAVAFAVATAGSGNPPDLPMRHKEAFKEAARRKCSITSNASTMRVVSVLRHWVTKHAQDFETNSRLKNLTIEFLEDIICTPSLLPSEHRAASQLLRMLTKEEPAQNIIDLESILAPTAAGTKDSIMTLSALEIAEQMTWLDQKILFTIMSSEFLGQAWTKPDKATRSPNICTITKRFNDMSRLVSTEIITQPCMTTRVQCIEKWAAVADICKCLHNFNGVLQICSALTNSSVYRLRNTWNRVSKSSRQTVEKLQNLVSSDGRFRNLRDSLHRTDPPCIPYLGMYLSDLTFIEEGTPNFTDNGLLNFAKMRMIAHVVREIRQFQQTPYKIEKIQKVLNYLLDTARLLDDEELYHRSLVVEPRTSRLSSSFGHGFATASVTMAVAAAAAAAAANSSSPKSSNH